MLLTLSASSSGKPRARTAPFMQFRWKRKTDATCLLGGAASR